MKRRSMREGGRREGGSAHPDGALWDQPSLLLEVFDHSAEVTCLCDLKHNVQHVLFHERSETLRWQWLNGGEHGEWRVRLLLCSYCDKTKSVVATVALGLDWVVHASSKHGEKKSMCRTRGTHNALAAGPALSPTRVVKAGWSTLH
jgi:hypothetical protein